MVIYGVIDYFMDIHSTESKSINSSVNTPRGQGNTVKLLRAANGYIFSLDIYTNVCMYVCILIYYMYIYMVVERAWWYDDARPPKGLQWAGTSPYVNEEQRENYIQKGPELVSLICGQLIFGHDTEPPFSSISHPFLKPERPSQNYSCIYLNGV